MIKVKTNAGYQSVDMGLDIHKTGWNVTVFVEVVYIHNIHQPISPKALYSFLTANF